MTRPGAADAPTVPRVRRSGGAHSRSNREWPFPQPPLHPAPTLTAAAPSVRRRAASRGGAGAVVVAAAIGALVAVGLGVYGRLHEPTGVAVSVAGFSSGIAAKSWLATGAFLLALVQLWSAAAVYGRVGKHWRTVGAPRWVGRLHRWSGRAAVLLTVPVAVHCLYALGYQDGTPRVLVHSLAGTFVYGAFVTKMLVLQQPHSPRWSLPLFGGALFTAITAVWLSSALWFFSTSGLSF